LKVLPPQNWKQKHQGQYNVELPFARMNRDITGMSPERRRNGDMPVGYFGRVTLRSEQCDMKARTARIVGPEAPVVRPWLNKLVSIAMNQHTSTKELLETVFSMRSMPRLYIEDEQGKLESPGQMTDPLSRQRGRPIKTGL
jgi:hypothetical protein